MSELLEIPWRQIRPMPEQPRTSFDMTKIRELADSIAEIGQVTPARVAPLPKGKDGKHTHELIDGQRRWHAVQLAGIATLRAEVVVEPDAEKRFEQSVVANFSREPHTPMEIARALERMRKRKTLEQCATSLGRSPDYVSKHLTLLRLHPDLQEMLAASLPSRDRLPLNAAFRLAQLEKADQMKAYTKVRASDMSPLKATVAVIGEMEAEAEKVGDERTLKRSFPGKKDGYARLRDRLTRVRTTLREMDGKQVARAAELRGEEGIAAIVDDLEKVIEQARAILAAMTGEKAKGRKTA